MNIEYKKFDIVLATPGRDMVSSYTKSLINTINFFNENDISYCYLNEYSPFLGDARQKTFDSFYKKYGLDAKYKKMIWIDSDISWSVQNIIDLYETEKDIVTGAYRITDNFIAAHKNPYHYFLLEDIKKMKDYEEILYCGMGFMSVDFGIIENIENPFMPVNYLYNNEYLSDFAEDVCFCIKSKLYLNKKIWLDPKIKVNHHKIQTWGWDGS